MLTPVENICLLRFGSCYIIRLGHKKQIDTCTREFPRAAEQLQMCKSPLHVLGTKSLHCSGKQQLAARDQFVGLYQQYYCFLLKRSAALHAFWDMHYHAPGPDMTGKVQGILEKRNCNYLREAGEM